MSRRRGNKRLNKDERRAMRKERRDRRQAINEGITPPEQHLTDYAPRVNTTPLEAKTEAQGHYIISIEQNKLTFGVGPAGTGKTYVCGAMAADALREKQTEKLIVTRPAVEAGESLGFLPGELEDKYAPYIQPFRDVLDERLGKSHVDGMLRAGRIEAAPMGFLRGRTFKNCWVILDEAQNTTPKQMKLFLTRLGENCKVIVNGDVSQRDIDETSGLEDAMRRLEHIRKVSVVTFSVEDVVRSGLVRDILRAYE